MENFFESEQEYDETQENFTDVPKAGDGRYGKDEKESKVKDLAFKAAPTDDEKPKGKGLKAKVVFDEEAARYGFTAPFTLMLAVDDDVSKKSLITAVTECLDDIIVKYPKNNEYVKMYRRWVCRTFNIADSAFDSPEQFQEEMNKVADNLDTLLSAKSSFSSTPISAVEERNVEDVSAFSTL